MTDLRERDVINQACSSIVRIDWRIKFVCVKKESDSFAWPELSHDITTSNDLIPSVSRQEMRILRLLISFQFPPFLPQSHHRYADRCILSRWWWKSAGVHIDLSSFNHDGTSYLFDLLIYLT